MNPKLVKFTLELQSSAKAEKENEKNNSNGGKKIFLGFYKPSYITIPINKD